MDVSFLCIDYNPRYLLCSVFNNWRSPKLRTSDNILGSECLGLLSYITSYRFIITAFTFKTIFDVLEPLNRILQSRDIDILSTVSVINKVKNIIQLYRTDKKFNKIIETIKVFIETCEIENFTPLENVRSRKKRVPRKADELCQDETEEDPLKRFKIDTFYLVLDLIIDLQIII